LNLTEKLFAFNEEIGKQEKDFKEKKKKLDKDSEISIKLLALFTSFSFLSLLFAFYLNNASNIETDIVITLKEITILISGLMLSFSIAEKIGEVGEIDKIESYITNRVVYILLTLTSLFINIIFLSFFLNNYDFVIYSYFFILLFLNINTVYNKSPKKVLSNLKIEVDKKNQIKTEYWNKTKSFIISEINKEVDDIKGFAILEELISENKLNNLRPVLEELGFEKARKKGFNSFLDYKIKKLENRVLLEMENE
tara:strand:- start:5753 stop:6511 length:759 start_codon:yes stop_codon:yes gene_type:complete